MTYIDLTNEQKAVVVRQYHEGKYEITHIKPLKGIVVDDGKNMNAVTDTFTINTMSECNISHDSDIVGENGTVNILKFLALTLRENNPYAEEMLQEYKGQYSMDDSDNLAKQNEYTIAIYQTANKYTILAMGIGMTSYVEECELQQALENATTAFRILQKYGLPNKPISFKIAKDAKPSQDAINIINNIKQQYAQPQ